MYQILFFLSFEVTYANLQYMIISIVQQKPRHWYLKTHISISRTIFNVIHIFSKCVQNIILFFIVKLLLLQNISK